MTIVVKAVVQLSYIFVNSSLLVKIRSTTELSEPQKSKTIATSGCVCFDRLVTGYIRDYIPMYALLDISLYLTSTN